MYIISSTYSWIADSPSLSQYKQIKVKESKEMLTERALESFKQFVETNIAYAMVEYGGTMHKPKILTRERLKDGRVALSISITPEVSGTTTITKIQLYDTASKLWAEKSEAIKLKGTQQGVLYRFSFNFKEE